MHCYCCDCLLENPQPDVKTGRYYCTECFSFTDDVIYYNQQKELEKLIEGYEPDFPDESLEVLDVATGLMYNEDQDE